MKNKILRGGSVASLIQVKLKEEVRHLEDKYKTNLKLAAVKACGDKGIKSYLEIQKKLAGSLGIKYELHPLDGASEDTLVRKVRHLNNDKSVNAIIILLPLPDKIDKKKILNEISPDKDVEGLHLQNLGRLIYRESRRERNYKFVLPCTAEAVLELLGEAGLKTQEDFRGKNTVIIGHSEIVGKPLALLLLNKLATVTVCHIGTKNIEEHIRRAEILVSAVGKAGLIKGKWIKDGAVVIDVGTSKVGNKIRGDVEFDEAVNKVSYITPVPGGVGPLTATMLMRNVVKLFKLQKK
jgi:methylenetetrahydrofolate dehydrogenase (NADP+) / methenyltetrahydrofolate cyclohydrolase